jgi:hypothetical protein
LIPTGSTELVLISPVACPSYCDVWQFDGAQEDEEDYCNDYPESLVFHLGRTGAAFDGKEENDRKWGEDIVLTSHIKFANMRHGYDCGFD